MNCLVACEESQSVTIALRKLGHYAFSCDLQECSGGFPEWHIKGDCLSVINGHCSFNTSDGKLHYISSSWDLVICHPPCTYLSYCGNRHFNIDKYGDKAIKRIAAREDAFDFAMRLYNCNSPHLAMENPVGYINTKFRKADQVINPFDFGDNYRKKTCLWLRDLPLLIPDYQIPPPEPEYIRSDGSKVYWVEAVGGIKDHSKVRSKTFPNVARAMAYQFTNNFYM